MKRRWLPTRPSLRPVAAASAPTGEVAGAGQAATGDVWTVWRQSGEVHYSTTFMARQVGRLSWRVTLAGEQVDPSDAADLIDRVTWPDGPAKITAAMALHMQVAGEYRYRHDPDTDAWQVTPARRRGLSSPAPDQFDVDLHTINRDPTNPDRADSPVRAAMPVATELMLLSALARSQARNRTAQRGLLLYPSEQQWPDGFDFGAMLQATMTAPLANEHQAAAVVPPQVPTPNDLIGSWRLLDLTTGWDDDLPERIEAVTRRLAMVLDHPPEVLLGVTDVNHWTAWQVSEDTYRAHVEPLAAWPAATLARAIAAAAGVDADQVDVEPDPSELLTRTPTVADTLRAYELGLVSDEFTRQVLGATDADAGDGVVRTTTPPTVDVPVDNDRGQPSTDEAGQPGPAVAAAADVVAPDRLGDVLARIDADLLEAGRARTDTTITTARARIGAIARTALRGNADATATIDGVDNADVAATLGVDVVARYVDLDRVTADVVTDQLASWWPDQLARATARIEAAAGITMPDNDSQVAQSVALLTDLVAGAVIGGLDKTQTRRGAPPTGAVRRALSVAGGNDDPGVTAAADVAAPDTMRTSGFATGHDALAAIRVQTGLTAQRWRWSYGDPGDRANPHPGHRRLAGQLVGNDGRVRTHDPQTGDTWNAYPGDHAGCQCDLVPAFRREG